MYYRSLAGVKNTVLHRLWRHERVPPEFLLHSDRHLPFKDLEPPPGIAPELAVSFEHYNQAEQHEYVIQFRRRCIIEPRRGWAFTPSLALIDESLPYGRDIPVKPPAYRRALLSGRRKEPAVISLRDPGETNYWHLFNDVLPRLILLDSLGAGDRVPILVSPELYERDYFRRLLSRSDFGKRTWILHAEDIDAGEAYFAKAMPHERKYFDAIVEKLAPPTPVTDSESRIFLTRAPARGRALTNGPELEKIARRHGFEIVDTDTLNFDEQIDLFAAARYVVGIHGAGLANLIFRRGKPLGLLEIFSPSLLAPQFYWLAHVYGYAYDAILGEGEPGLMADFRLDPAEFERRLSSLLDSSSKPSRKG